MRSVLYRQQVGPLFDDKPKRYNNKEKFYAMLPEMKDFHDFLQFHDGHLEIGSSKTLPIADLRYNI